MHRTDIYSFRQLYVLVPGLFPEVAVYFILPSHVFGCISMGYHYTGGLAAGMSIASYDLCCCFWHDVSFFLIVHYLHLLDAIQARRILGLCSNWSLSHLLYWFAGALLYTW
jgi:hypothetical protein